MTTTETKYRDLLPVVVETSGAQMPEGFNSWGLKAVHPDLTTTRNFRWAMPGGVNVSNDHLLLGNTSACPNEPGDGLCVATTWRGMASVGFPSRTLLLVAYRAADVVGRDDSRGKLRIGGVVASVALIDGERFVLEHGQGLNLSWANLRDLNLQNANMHGANLCGASLWRANLRRANLQDAYLRRANIEGADLQGADLQGADLHSAYLRSADLRHADLQGANLQWANLRGANLRCANLQGADLRDAFWSACIATPDGWTRASNGRLARKTTP